MSKKIKYKKEMFDFIKELMYINTSIAFERIDDRIVVRKSNVNQTLPYIASFPLDYFEIDDTVAFYKYDDFHRYLSSIKNADISIDDIDMIISKGGTTIKYRLSDEDGIINGPKSVNFDDYTATFVLSAEDLLEISRIDNNVKSTYARIVCIDDEVQIKFYSDGNDNSFERVFKVERIGDYDEDFAMTIYSDRFSQLPTKRDYNVNISAQNFINISLIHDEIEFDLYSGDVQ